MPIELGPYRFSLTDARKTLWHAIDVLDLYRDRVGDAQAGRRRRIEVALGGLAVMDADERMLERPLAAVWAELLHARDDLLATGCLPPTASGVASRLSRSDGGVPKAEVEQIRVGFAGVVGDRQRSRVHHGRPWQALCLWSSEVIDGLAAEGHPIGPGSAGENITISGLAWEQVEPGVRLRIGDVVCEVSSYALPCANLKPFFSDADFRRVHHTRGPISRVYATVLEPGSISVGDPSVLEP